MQIKRNRGVARSVFFSLVLVAALNASGQTAYFVDGFHGGVWGHYPETFTQFMVDTMQKNPSWKLGLEIEPETWDWVETNTPGAYAAFKKLAEDQSADGRIEFVNPAYGQSYLWNISGECVIQQLERGMRKIREHFPNAAFMTYSSEEPCFTSALPGILTSLGFHDAVLKNPNTCWGGYTAAHGRELVNWIGPDGTAIRTVSRYGVEALKPGSTWETMASANYSSYVAAALADVVQHPVGMCLQDAGWRFGPWLSRASNSYKASEYVTWRRYFEDVTQNDAASDWPVSQEDVRVSLVWGAQVLQRVAQECRQAENKIVAAEKMATLACVLRGMPWPSEKFDAAWRTLLLSQHHDCWIVPYNRHGDGTWADHVAQWTSNTCQISDQIIAQVEDALTPESSRNGKFFVRVFNTQAEAREDVVEVDLPSGWSSKTASVLDGSGREIPSQITDKEIVFAARAPVLGWSTYEIATNEAKKVSGAKATREADGLVQLETDLYSIILDPGKGGAIRSLKAKRLGGREMIDTANGRAFNAFTGYFTAEHEFHSTAESAAKIDVIGNGPARVSVQIRGQIASNSVTQWITLSEGDPRIDCRARIDWEGSPRIGVEGSTHYDARQDKKAFYNDEHKLRVLFPMAPASYAIFKDDPFDVTRSGLTNTYFDHWSEIKNATILDWVDACDEDHDVGMALLTDHTTSYSHGPDNLLGLTVQYCGVGLWGRDYTMRAPTEIHYALLPHQGDWEKAKLWNETARWHEPLLTKVFRSDNSARQTQSLLAIGGTDWNVPAMEVEQGQIVARLFNATTRSNTRTITYDGPVKRAELVKLDGAVVKTLDVRPKAGGGEEFDVDLPAFGVGTIQITP